MHQALALVRLKNVGTLLKAIKEAFPKHRIHELKDALYANVKGFQLAGVEYAKTLIASESGQAKAGTDSVGA